MKKVVSIILPVLILFFSYNVFVNSAYVDAMAFRLGSSNMGVEKIEQGLKWLGYFEETPDSYYASDTKSAVARFQKDSGIKADGVMDEGTLEALNRTIARAKKNNIQSSEMTLLTRAINGEARGEPYIGQVAVGAVIINRTRDPRFPKTIAGVVYQPGAFTAINDGQIHSKLEATPKKAAQDAMNGWDPTGGCVYYYNPAKTTNKWIWSRPVLKIIGKHRFAK